MKNSTPQRESPKLRSISRRLSYAFVGVVTLMLIGFASVAIFVNITRLNTQLENRLDNALHLARISLPKPLWNLDGDIVADFVKSLFLDESVVFARVLWANQVVSVRARKDFEEKDFSHFERSPEFIAKASEILFEGSKVGTIQIAMSREHIRREFIFNVSGIVGLTVLMFAAISVTSVLITRRYIARPLLKLQGSATRIAQGDLEASIDTASADEIGTLAANLNTMRESIKGLFGELRESHEKLEEHSRTLEQKVEERTAELARAMGEAEEARGAAEEASRAKSAFLANMSHELRTPLNAIIGFTRLVLRKTEGQIPPLQKENLQKVTVSAEHLLNLINGLLDLSKIEAGRVEVLAETFKLDEVIQVAAATMEPMLKDGRVRLITAIAPGIPDLNTDRDKLRQIVLNLLSNAAKFTDEGEIRVAAWRENESLKLVVSDTGIGMKEDALEYVFEEFRQADMSSTRRYGGTGLGLAIVKRFVNLLGGNIGVESEVGVGTKFTITLPLCLKRQMDRR